MSNLLTLADAINAAMNTGKEATFTYNGVLYDFNPAGILSFLEAEFDITAPDSITTEDLTASGTVILSGLPTADPEVEGQLWSNSGVLTVSAGEIE